MLLIPLNFLTFFTLLTKLSICFGGILGVRPAQIRTQLLGKKENESWFSTNREEHCVKLFYLDYHRHCLTQSTFAAVTSASHLVYWSILILVYPSFQKGLNSAKMNRNFIFQVLSWILHFIYIWTLTCPFCHMNILKLGPFNYNSCLLSMVVPESRIWLPYCYEEKHPLSIMLPLTCGNMGVVRSG